MGANDDNVYEKRIIGGILSSCLEAVDAVIILFCDIRQVTSWLYCAVMIPTA